MFIYHFMNMDIVFGFDFYELSPNIYQGCQIGQAEKLFFLNQAAPLF